MKKNRSILLAAFTLCFYTVLTAQVTSPYWSQSGNNNATSTSKLGTTTNQNLNIVTNNITRVFLNTNGNIGINTIAPRAPIHVAALNKDSGIYAIARKYGIVGVDTTTTDVGETGRRPNSAGVFGLGGSYGVYGESARIGVYGLGSASPSGSGTGIGVLGVTQFGDGVKGISEGTGVHGNGVFQGVYGYGIAFGVHAETPLELSFYGDGTAVYGKGRIGVKGEAVLYGLHGKASDPDSGRGVYGTGIYGVSGQGVSFGVYGRGRTGVYGTTTTSLNDAMRAEALGASASWGIYASSQTSYGIYASTLAPASYAGYFAGSVYSTGSYIGSDEKLKQQVQPLKDGLEIISKLAPKNYIYRQDGDFAKMNLPTGNQYGLIAQEVEQVLPELVKGTLFPIGKIKADEKYHGNYPKDLDQKSLEETIEHKAVNYTALIPVLIKATQELNEKVGALQNENKAIKEELERLKNSGTNTTTAATTLLQNVPNPVMASTTIAYALPVNYSKAQIAIADSKGSMIKQMNITGAGKGNVQVDVARFSSGTYTYSLLIDGKTIATKQMIVAK